MTLPKSIGSVRFLEAGAATGFRAHRSGGPRRPAPSIERGASVWEETGMGFALGIFAVAYLIIASEKLPRHWVAPAAGAVLVVAGILTPREALEYVSWETIGLLAGMFTLVSVLHEAGFFSWLAMASIRRVNYQPAPLFFALMAIATVCAMFMDSITVMLFLSALTIPLCRLLKIDPVPMVIGLVCAANTGGAATLVGDPPNVILGTALGFGFADFVAHTGPIALTGALLLTAYFYLVNRKAFAQARKSLDAETIRDIEALHAEPLHARMTRLGLAGFGAAVFLLILHKYVSPWTGLPINEALAAVLPALFVLAGLPGFETKRVIRRIDYQSLLFFGGLFVIIGGLEKTGVFDLFSERLAALAGDPHAFVLTLHWVPGVLSGVVDNVPLALAMTYVLKDLAQAAGMPALSLMVWALALGVDIGGNLTPIGASANVVAYAALDRESAKPGWGRWIVLAGPVTLLVMLVASGLVLAKSFAGWF
jgi:Na+/H+ antiporter NhaD/arsenite permease-like protein